MEVMDGDEGTEDADSSGVTDALAPTTPGARRSLYLYLYLYLLGYLLLRDCSWPCCCWPLQSLAWAQKAAAGGARRGHRRSGRRTRCAPDT